MTPPLSMTVKRMPGRRRSRSRAPRGITSWYLVERVAVSIVLPDSYRTWIGRSIRCHTTSQQRAAQHEQRDAEVDHQARHVDQRRDEGRRGAGRIEAEPAQQE